jgi:hypothetical protein
VEWYGEGGGGGRGEGEGVERGGGKVNAAAETGKKNIKFSWFVF